MATITRYYLDGQKPEYFDVDVDFLVEGTNVIAVQVHNQSSTSSDMTALPVLIIGHQYYGIYLSKHTELVFSAYLCGF